MRTRVVVALLSVAALGACASPREQYCDVVRGHQERLGEIAASGDPGRTFDVLPAYRDLRDHAPDDIADDWAVVVDALEGLRTALDDAGVDASYDADEPPAGVTPADRRTIERAADALGSTRTLDAMSSVEQQSLDVCKTPLAR